MSIKFYGYPDKKPSSEQCGPLTLREVTLSASPAELRRIANFLIRAAGEIEQHGAEWEHEHLCDCEHGFDDAPSFVIFNPALDQS